MARRNQYKPKHSGERERRSSRPTNRKHRRPAQEALRRSKQSRFSASRKEVRPVQLAKAGPVRYTEGEQGGGAVKEQLALFGSALQPAVWRPLRARGTPPTSPRNVILTLLASDLNFHDKASSYASHNLHAFAAKFPPQLPRMFIEALTKPGDLVLDPMMGSGTALVEAALGGRSAIGFDLDPLAVRLARVKTRPVDVTAAQQNGTRVLLRAHRFVNEKQQIEEALASRFDKATRDFLHYWFLPETQRELMALILALEEVAPGPVRQFLEIVLSSTIVTKSGGVTLARDLAHTRPHRDLDKKPRSAIDVFRQRLAKSLASMGEVKRTKLVTVVNGDARFMPLRDGRVDLIVTSPPYANAIDYMRAHKFSLVWFGESLSGLSALRSRYVGSERLLRRSRVSLPGTVEESMRVLAKQDQGKARVARQYFQEMTLVISEMYRVLKPGAAAIVVVGPSTMRGLTIQTHSHLAEVGAERGFEVVGVARRTMDRDRRMMPARAVGATASVIEQRMHEEYVIAFLKNR